MRPTIALACLALAASGCDVDRPWPAPEPGLERMVKQQRGAPFTASGFFADGKSMRAAPRGAVPYGETAGSEEPPRVDAASMALGREQFRVICATCHGEAGDGQSPVAAFMELRKPPSLHEPRLRALSGERLFQIIGQGYGLMPGYATVLAPHERWAVVAYVRALQLSRAARLDELPQAVRSQALEALR